ncbi:hypothetical protein [Actinoallomurus iriomotensis]|uniref:Uncharacterized protein n=1 Tax=Actinoallomurus iriomotensis TaxID=478107 RepID=A0A9W6VXD5_9ACTN|nr:hypothetical protein [Actinoallomurus iriomotensis]GLY74629.1 hypothetical protein Airi01_028960 [Actinoallomurus iriomotensis]GLY83750.1 hypothetical protein Airi02_016790 [Actinoallomurus iriomotensis]
MTDKTYNRFNTIVSTPNEVAGQQTVSRVLPERAGTPARKYPRLAAPDRTGGSAGFAGAIDSPTW